MTDGVRFGSAAVLLTALLLASLIALADEPLPTQGKGVAGAPAPAAHPAPPRPERIDGLDPLHHELRDGKRVAELPDGRRAELTLDPGLQAHLTRVLSERPVPRGAAVALEPATGRVLAYVSHSDADPDGGDLVRDASAPAASVFKVVTAAALVDAGVSATARVCYQGGSRQLVASHLTDDPRRDQQCATLETALGQSINAIFAKLADKHLDTATLDRYAQAFGFGHALPFDVPTRRSEAEVPADRLERARTAAGFWHTHLSPLHGALLAATVANDGMMPRPGIVERIVERDGAVALSYEPRDFRQVIPRTTARAVGQMMRGTVEDGTSRRAFHDARGRPVIPGVEIAGKTGSLSDSEPYRAYSWWIGFAPVDAPTIALATLVVNEPIWHIKANQVAVEAMRYWFVERPKRLTREPPAAVVAAGTAEKPVPRNKGPGEGGELAAAAR